MTNLIVIECEYGVLEENHRQVHAEGCADIQRFLNKPHWKITYKGESILEVAEDHYGDLASDYTDPEDGAEYWIKACLNEAFGYLTVKPCAKQIVDAQIKPYEKIEVNI